MNRSSHYHVENDFPFSDIMFKRDWKFTKLGDAFNLNPRDDCFEFTVLTYNILSQKALQRHIRLYQQCNPEHLQEGYRVANIINELLSTEADVICLQEVEEHVYQELTAILGHRGYKGVFKLRTGTQTDGCCLLWRDSQFRCLEQRAVEFKVDGLKHMEKDNIGLIVCLKPRCKPVRDVKLHVATTHLLFNPRRGDVKLCQLRLLLAELDEMAAQVSNTPDERVEEFPRHDPTILCGDLNIEPFSPLYNFLELCAIPIRQSMYMESLSGQLVNPKKRTPIANRNVSLEKINIGDGSTFVKNVERSRTLGLSFDKKTVNNGGRTVTLKCGQADRRSFISERPDGFHHGLNFISALSLVPGAVSQNSKTFTSIVGEQVSSVDHIFYNLKRLPDDLYCRNFCEDRLLLMGFLELMRKKDVRGSLPNSVLSSDHILLMSKFLIVPTKETKVRRFDVCGVDNAS